MPDKDAGTPRVFLIRHGETAWTQTGQFTGRTDLPLLPEGEVKIRDSAQVVGGPGKLIDPSNLALVVVSPRQRARKTWEIFAATAGITPKAKTSEEDTVAGGVQVEVTEDIAEWDYGLYEGMLTTEIRQLRKEHGLDVERAWNIWRDGCEEGHSPLDVTKRLDRLITRIKEIQSPHMHDGRLCDIVVVAHGHILRAFIKRWLKYDLDFPLSMMLEPGGVCGLSYQHANVNEPAVLVGMSFPEPQ